MSKALYMATKVHTHNTQYSQIISPREPIKFCCHEDRRYTSPSDIGYEPDMKASNGTCLLHTLLHLSWCNPGPETQFTKQVLTIFLQDCQLSLTVSEELMKSIFIRCLSIVDVAIISQPIRRISFKFHFLTALDDTTGLFFSDFSHFFPFTYGTLQEQKCLNAIPPSNRFHFSFIFCPTSTECFLSGSHKNTVCFFTVLNLAIG